MSNSFFCKEMLIVVLVKGKNGYFPSDYAQIIETPVAAVVPPPPPPKPVASSSTLRAKVMFDFSGTGKGEMPLKVGTTIDVVTRGPAGGWSKGAAGAFPTDYVQFIEPTSAATSTIAAESKPFSASTASNFPVKSSIPASSAKSDPFADLPIPLEIGKYGYIPRLPAGSIKTLIFSKTSY